MDGGPGRAQGVIDEDLSVAVVALETPVEDDFLVALHHGARVVGDLAWRPASSCNAFPLDRVEWVLLQGVDACQTHSPHRVDGTLFQIASTVNIQTRAHRFQ